MEFSTIQNGNSIERYYLNGLRVNRDRYEHEETLVNIKNARFYSFGSQTLKSGKTKHRKYSTI